ncbi:MAG: hypothetical protein JWN22_606 [Nocardioides sp.]|nr:hypothetical protein [Nocardioides sp.]
MSLDIEVRGDPAACRDTARRLNRLASAVDDASNALARQAHLSEHDFGGLSGDVFRDHAARLAASGDRTSRRCARLARAADELALDLEDVTGLMQLATEAARPWLTVDATTIRPPGVDPRPDDPWVVKAWSAWHRAVLVVDRARAVEHRAQHDWRTALWQLAGATPPAARWDLEDITDGEWPDADGVPAYDPALGPHLAEDAGTPGEHDRSHRHHHHLEQSTGPAAQASGGAQVGTAAVGHGPSSSGGCGAVPTWHAAVGHVPGDHGPLSCGTSPVPAIPDPPTGAGTPPAPGTPAGPLTCGTSPVPPLPPPACGTSPVSEVLRAAG